MVLDADGDLRQACLEAGKEPVQSHLPCARRHHHHNLAVLVTKEGVRNPNMLDKGEEAVR